MIKKSGLTIMEAVKILEYEKNNDGIKTELNSIITLFIKP